MRNYSFRKHKEFSKYIKRLKFISQFVPQSVNELRVSRIYKWTKNHSTICSCYLCSNFFSKKDRAKSKHQLNEELKLYFEY